MNNQSITVMWAHPRSMSTAMERMMRERGDCACLHEPFMYFYYVDQAHREMPFFNVDPEHPSAFLDIIELFEKRAKSQPLFAKDMAYYVVPAIFEHPELATSINHIFLVRSPYRSIASYFQLDPDIRSEEIGFNAQWELFQWIQQNSGSTPLVISAENVQANTEISARQLWSALGLEFKPEALKWDRNVTPPDWEQVATWHEKTSRTGGIQKDETDIATATRHFASLATQHPGLEKMLADHLVAYQSLKAVADQQWQSHMTSLA